MSFPAWTLAPFALMLAAIAIAPLVPKLAPHWEITRNQLIYALVLGVPVAIWVIAVGRGELVVHSVIEYAQFIILLLVLFVVSGGIFLRGDLAATPRTNTIFLAIGGLIASFIGTTGAAMLLIRPLLNTNSERKHVAHTVVFSIFIAANCGGLLTPLGDPPLFLGMLYGVPFTWTFSLIGPWAFVNILLLVTYWALDRRLITHERPEDVRKDREQVTPLKLVGAVHFLFFAVVIFSVAFLPSIDAEQLTEGHAHGLELVPWREIVMLLAAFASYKSGSRSVRFTDNQFEFGPIKEVAALFIGIFLTMTPALEFLREIAPTLPLNKITLFVFTGGLSSVLDNAPTYATFFEMASQMPGDDPVAGVPHVLLASVSLGAVLCGAMTYIGNGPNFMVKSVAESRSVTMPSFGGYVLRALTYLAPVLAAMVLLFIAESTAAHIVGALVVLGLLARALIIARRHDGVAGSAKAGHWPRGAFETKP